MKKLIYYIYDQPIEAMVTVLALATIAMAIVMEY